MAVGVLPRPPFFYATLYPAPLTGRTFAPATVSMDMQRGYDMRHMKSVWLAVAVVAIAAGCDDTDDPTQVIDIDARGTYELTELTFDPQGVLPKVDLRSRITGTIPKLTLATNGQAQLVFEDPETGLITVSDATYDVTNAGAIRLDFGSSNSLYDRTFLSREMTFDYTSDPASLTFSAASPEGVSRERLLQLVPEWEDEQLLDPVPGTLTVVFREQIATQ
jgi:hypothetical protein